MEPTRCVDMRQWRLREVRRLAPGHTAAGWKSGWARVQAMLCPPSPSLGPSPRAPASSAPQLILQRALPGQGLPRAPQPDHGCVAGENLVCFLFIDSARRDAGHGVRV